MSFVRPGDDELYDVVDDEDRVIGRADRARVHNDPSLIHRAVHVLLFRPDGRLIMQKRVKQKDVEPDKWDTSVGGHVDAGEDYESAAYREMKEELGIEGLELERLYDLKYRSGAESENIRTYRAVYAGPLAPSWFEIERVREWTLAEIRDHLGRGVFTNSFEHEWRAYHERLADSGDDFHERLGLKSVSLQGQKK